jgi:CheY-like chemotaxis protein
MIKRKILVVEDEMIIARDIVMQLCDLGYEPLGPADTGEQAIEMARQLRPDLVLMDVHLGSAMDGIEAAQAIRTQFDIPTVFLSAFSGDANRARAQLAKPAGYLAKPFEDYELREVIAAAFKR